MTALVAFASGLLFAVGLAIGGMTQPSKIVGFLDFGGAWDPSLALVMVGALSVLCLAQRIVRRRAAPLFAPTFPPPPPPRVDARLVVGAALFGIGWGLIGFCPGPVLVSFGGGMRAALVVLPSMLGGMLLYRFIEARLVR